MRDWLIRVEDACIHAQASLKLSQHWEDTANWRVMVDRLHGIIADEYTHRQQQQQHTREALRQQPDGEPPEVAV
jgi:hypothetical protein